MVQSIQALVATIRSEQGLHNVQTHVSAIGNVVANVVSATEHLIREHHSDVSLRERSEPIVQALDECRGRLIATADEGHEADSPEKLRELTNRLPPIAFEMARHTKELVQRLESLAQADDDDFR